MSEADTAAPEQINAARLPVMTILACGTCCVVFLGLLGADFESWEDYVRWGYRPPNDVWSGRIDALITSAFVHVDPWHLALNLYWLWHLGRVLEILIGWWHWGLFFVVAAFVSSAAQLFVSDDTGIGASGVVYAIFGFLWQVRGDDPRAAAILPTRIVHLFLWWAVICLVLTRLEILMVGNAAHFTGLLFGVLAAHAFAGRSFQTPARLALATFALVGTGLLLWCPWSPTWLWMQAHNAHIAEDYDSALLRYTQLIRRVPQDATALYNRSLVNMSLGNLAEARADYARAVELDPDLAEAEWFE